MQFRDEFSGRRLREDLRLRAVAAEKAGQALLRLQRIDQPGPIVLLRQSFLVRRAQEEPAQPLGEIAANQQQVALLQFAQERLDLAAVRNQVVRVLQDVLVVNREHRRGARLAEQIKQERFTGSRLPILGQVLSLAGRQVR